MTDILEEIEWKAERAASAQRIVDKFEQMLAESVARARGEGLTWDEIGDALGMTRQGAQQRYGR